MTVEAQEQLDRFDDHLDEIEDQLGVDLTAGMRAAIYRGSLANGFDRDATETAAALVVADHLGIELTDTSAEPDDITGPEGDGQTGLTPEEGERLVRDYNADIARVERELDRPLLRAEKAGIAQRVAERVERFGDMPENTAMDALREHHNGQIPDHHTASGRNWFATQRLQEAESPPAEEDDSLDGLDLDDPKDRERYAVARLNGAEFEAEDDEEADQDARPGNLDLDDPADRQSYMLARLRGDEFSVDDRTATPVPTEELQEAA